MTFVCGIDEAGRGPVIGPMVICGVLVKEKDMPKLSSLGVKDSKLLTRNTRKILFEQIKKMVLDFNYVIIPPKEIDNALKSNHLNLNWLEAEKTAEIINKISKKTNINKVIIDCPSNNDKSYIAYILERLINKKLKLIAEHKADLIYPVVSAASIIAKVIRDREIDKLKKRYNVDFGSGYPSDKKTQDFLKKNYNKYDFFRKTWISYKEIALKNKQKNLKDFA